MLTHLTTLTITQGLEKIVMKLLKSEGNLQKPSTYIVKRTPNT